MRIIKQWVTEDGTNLIKSIDRFFKNQEKDIQKSFHKHTSEICRKEKVSLQKVFSVLFFYYYFCLLFLYINHRHNMPNLLKIEACYSKYHECTAEKVRNFISESSWCCWTTTSMILLVMQVWVSYNISWTNKHLCHNFV